MTSRSFLAIVLCPTLGLVAGSWVAVEAIPWALSTLGHPPAGGAVGELQHMLYGAAGGVVVGLIWSGVMIWLFARGPGSPQRALADLITIALACAGLVDGGLGLANLRGLVTPGERVWHGLWSGTAIVWLLGLALSLIAFRRARRLRAWRAVEGEREETVGEDDLTE